VATSADRTRRRLLSQTAAVAVGTRAAAAVGAAAASALLAGCAGRGPVRGSGSGPVVYWGGADPAAVVAHRARLTRTLARAGRATGRPVTLRVLPWQSLFTELTRAVLAGTGPDVAEIRTGWSVTLQATGGLREVDADVLALLGGRRRFLDAPWHTAGAGGRPASSVPVRAGVRVLLHDRAALAGARLPGPPQTWPQLQYAAPTLTAAGRHVLSWAGADLDALVDDLTLLTRQAGGQLLAGETPRFVDAPVPQALALRLELGSRRWADPAEARVSDPEAPVRAVLAGRAVAAVVDSAALAAVLAAPPRRRSQLGVSPCPTFAPDPGDPRTVHLRSLTAGTNLVVPRASAQPGAAWRLVAHLTDDVSQGLLDPATGTLPVTARAWAARTSPVDLLVHAILTGGSLPTPATVHQPELRGTLGATVHDLLAARPGAVPTPESQLAALTAAQLAFGALP